MRFSFKKKITPHDNKDKINLQNETSLVDLSMQKDKKEIEAEQEENEKREITNHKREIKNSEKSLELNSNSNKENKLTLQKEKTENGKGIDIEDEDTCNRCKEYLGDNWKKPHWKWNINKNIKFCFNCYQIKEIEYEKMINYCIVCDSKLKFYRYNPRPEWKVKGQLCRKCWDSKNTTYKNEKLKK